MSGHSDLTTCPNCGQNMHIYIDWKPFDWTSGECLECGFYFRTVTGQMSLKELNGMRADAGYKPRKRRAKGKLLPHLVWS